MNLNIHRESKRELWRNRYIYGEREREREREREIGKKYRGREREIHTKMIR